MKKISTSWQLLCCAFRILRGNRKLLLFALPYVAALLVFLLFFLIPALPGFVGTLSQPDSQPAPAVSATTVTPAASPPSTSTDAPQTSTSSSFYLTLAVIYLFTIFSVTFLNVALCNEIIRAMDGDTVSVRRGLRFALQRFWPILLWSLLAGTVGLLLRRLDRRLKLGARIATALTGVAWSAAAVFVIPSMIREEQANPFKLLRNSAFILKKTWGESVAGYSGVLFLQLVVMFITGLPMMLVALVAGATQQPWLLVIPFLLWGILIMIFSFGMNIANEIYRCALYLYASEGIVPEPFSPELMDAAWKVKKR